MENSVKWYITRKILGLLSQICISLMILRLTTKSFLLFGDNEIILYTSEGSTVSLTTMVLETFFVVLFIATLFMFFAETILSNAGLEFQSIVRLFLKVMFLYVAGGLFVLIFLDRIDLSEKIVSLFLAQTLLKKMDQYLDKKETEGLVQSGYFQLQRKTAINGLITDINEIDPNDHQEKQFSLVEYFYQFKYWPLMLTVAIKDGSESKFIDSIEATFKRLSLMSLTVYFSFLVAVKGAAAFYLPGTIALFFLWAMRKDTMLLINSCKDKLTKIKRNRG